MLTLGLIALFAVAAVTAVAMLTWQVADAAPKIAQLKTALAECPHTRELRFTIREITVSPRHGQVVAMPVRIKPLALPQALRAAA